VANGSGAAASSTARPPRPGSSQLADSGYRSLFERHAAIVLTEDDLLWWRLRPAPASGLQFGHADRIVSLAEQAGMLVLGAHLVWDEGFGNGWSDEDLRGLDEAAARGLLLGTVESTVERYRGRIAGWIVANEVLDGSGLRTDVPWYQTIGPSYVADALRTAREADPDATLALNDFGYETDQGPATAAAKRASTLAFLDELLADGVPVHALGVQAHLRARGFGERFDSAAYARFLADVADRGLRILITELDVLDDGLPDEVRARDRAVADVLRRYLDTALAEPAVAAVLTFGLSDRYSWLREADPGRRPLPFDASLRPKLALEALEEALSRARPRTPLWDLRRD
jgi:endo-1,4-beta-xylanase